TAGGGSPSGSPRRRSPGSQRERSVSRARGIAGLDQVDHAVAVAAAPFAQGRTPGIVADLQLVFQPTLETGLDLGPVLLQQLIDQVAIVRPGRALEDGFDPQRRAAALEPEASLATGWAFHGVSPQSRVRCSRSNPAAMTRGSSRRSMDRAREAAASA